MNFSSGIILHENETGINLSIDCSRNNLTTPKNTALSTSWNHRPWDFWDISLLFLVIFGLIGNILSIIVMNRIRIRNTNANLFVTSMAITDCLFLTIKFFSNIVKLYRIPIFTACIAIHHVLPHTILFVSVWLVILTALERAVAVHYPLRVARLFSPNRCKFFITIMCVVFFLVSNTTTPCLDYHKNMTSLCMIKGQIEGACFNFYTYVFPWVKVALGAWIPSVLGILLNAIIARGVFSASRVRKSMSVNSDMPKKIVQNTTLSPCTSENLLMKSSNSKNLMIATNYIPKQSVSSQRDSPLLGNHNNHHHNNKSSSSSSSEKQLTIMLMTISISFMILSFPHSAFELMRKLNFQFAFLRDRQANRFVLFFLDVQHATNFILYCLTGRKFRNELLNMLLLRWRPMPNKIRRDTLLSGATI